MATIENELRRAVAALAAAAWWDVGPDEHPLAERQIEEAVAATERIVDNAQHDFRGILVATAAAAVAATINQLARSEMLLLPRAVQPELLDELLERIPRDVIREAEMRIERDDEEVTD